MPTEIGLTEECKKELLKEFDDAVAKLRSNPDNFQPGGYCLLLKKERNRPVVLFMLLKLDSNFLHWGDLSVWKEKLPKKMTISDLVKKGWILLSKETAGVNEKDVRYAYYWDLISNYHATLSETCYFKDREDFFKLMATTIKVCRNTKGRVPMEAEEISEL